MKRNINCPNYKEVMEDLKKLPEDDVRKLAGAEIWEVVNGYMSDYKGWFKDNMTAAIYVRIKKYLK
jgi:hypothetical protein